MISVLSRWELRASLLRRHPISRREAVCDQISLPSINSSILFPLSNVVHGSLARAGKVKNQTPKVPKQDKTTKVAKGRAHKRVQYNRRFVNSVAGFNGKQVGPNNWNARQERYFPLCVSKECKSVQHTYCYTYFSIQACQGCWCCCQVNIVSMMTCDIYIYS